ncbi:hypothetical protein SPRG_18104, partial [Saprolegnia parasitica CBS 223.65]
MESHVASLAISQGEVRMLNEILHSPVARHRPSHRYAQLCPLSDPPPQNVNELPTTYEPPPQYDIGFITNSDASRMQHPTYGAKETETRAVSYSSSSPCTPLGAMYANAPTPTTTYSTSSGYKPVDSPRVQASVEVPASWSSYGTPPQYHHEPRGLPQRGQGYELSPRPVQALVPPSFGTLSYMPTYLPGTNIQYQHNYSSISRPYGYQPPAETARNDEQQDNTKKPPRTCKYANCMKTIQRHGLCHKHGG